MTGIEKGLTIFLGGLVAVALVTTLVSHPNTPQVLGAAGGALSGSLLASQGQS